MTQPTGCVQPLRELVAPRICQSGCQRTTAGRLLVTRPPLLGVCLDLDSDDAAAFAQLIGAGSRLSAAAAAGIGSFTDSAVRSESFAQGRVLDPTTFTDIMGRAKQAPRGLWRQSTDSIARVVDGGAKGLADKWGTKREAAHGRGPKGWVPSCSGAAGPGRKTLCRVLRQICGHPVTQCDASAKVVNVEPSKIRVLLVGPRVVHLRTVFEKRRYRVVTADNGIEGMELLGAGPSDVIVLELNLGDLTATEFLMAVREGHPRAIFFLVDESTKAGQIIKALQAGLDGYLATPPDEDRLFYEVERHLRRGAPLLRGAPPLPGGLPMSRFEEQSVQTTVESMAEIDALADALADRESQVVDLQDQLTQAQNSLLPLRNDTRRLEEIQQAFGGLLDGPLDAQRALHLKEQVVMAQFVGLEVGALRSETRSARDAKVRLQAELDACLSELRQARSDAAAIPEDKSTQFEEMQGALLATQGRVADAEVAAAAATEALSVSKDKHAEALVEVETLKAVIAQRETTVARLEAMAATGSANIAAERHADKVALAAERGSQQAALVALRAAFRGEQAAAKATAAAAKISVDDEILRLRLEAQQAKDEGARREQEVKQARAEVNHEKARAAQEEFRRPAREQAAVQAALSKEGARLQKIHDDAMTNAAVGVADDVAKQLAAERVRLGAITQAAVERATDSELQLEEARMRIEYIEAQAETVRSASIEQAKRVQFETDKRVKDIELNFKKEKLRLVDEKQHAASGSQEAALLIERFASENLALKKQHTDLLADKVGGDDAIKAAEERTAVADAAAVRAREEATEAARRFNNVADGQIRLEAAMGAVQAHARNLEAEIDLERARAAAAVAVAAGIPDLQAAHERAMAHHAQDHARSIEAVRGDHAVALGQAQSAMDTEVSALRAYLAEERQGLEGEMTRVRRDGQAAHAHSSQVVAHLQHRLDELEPIAGERNDPRTRVGVMQAEGQIVKPEFFLQLQLRQQELESWREQLAIAQSTSSSAVQSEQGELLRVRTAEIEGNSAAHSSVLANLRSLLDAIEPLLQGRSSAIDYVNPLDSNDQSIGFHAKNLRVLLAKLTGLAAEINKAQP